MLKHPIAFLARKIENTAVAKTVLALLCLAVFIPFLNRPFFGESMEYMRGIIPLHIPSGLPFAPSLILSVYKYLFGVKPFFIHLAALCIHIWSALLVFNLPEKVFKQGRTASFVIAAIFCLHPAGILAQLSPLNIGEMICFALILKTLLIANTPKSALKIIIMFFAAVLCSPTAVLIPIFFAVLYAQKKYPGKYAYLSAGIIIGIILYFAFSKEVKIAEMAHAAGDMCALSLFPFFIKLLAGNLLYPVIMFVSVLFTAAAVLSFIKIKDKTGIEISIFALISAVVWVSIKPVLFARDFTSYGYFIFIIFIAARFFQNILMFHPQKSLKLSKIFFAAFALFVLSELVSARCIFNLSKKSSDIMLSAVKFYRQDEVLTAYSDILIKEGDTGRLYPVLKKLLKDSGSETASEIYARMGVILARENYAKKAEEYFVLSLKQNPANETAVLEFADNLMGQGRYDDAMELLNSLPDTKNAEILKKKANIYLLYGDYKKSFETVSAACKINKNYCGILC